MMDVNFAGQIQDGLIRMRLIIEGTNSFSEDAQALCWLGRKNEMERSADALEMLCCALFELRKEIIALQEDCRQVIRQEV